MFAGSLVALVTPMKPNGDIDYQAFELLIAWHLSNGTDGFVILGTTGESATITAPERKQLIQLAVSLLSGKSPLIVGTGTNSTSHSIELTREAFELGADAVLLVTPYYNKPTQEGLYQHYAAIAKAVPVLQILYNNPGRTACDLLPETMIRLKSHTNIIAIKETVHDLSRYEKILHETKLIVLGGNDSDALELLLAGGKGIISVVANVIPKEFSELCHAALQGEDDKARALDAMWRPLVDALFVESNPIPTKWALNCMGMIEQGIRLPLTWLSDASQQCVKTVLKNRGIV